MSEVVEVGIMGYSGMDGVRVVEIEEVIQNWVWLAWAQIGAHQAFSISL
jgi:hypothetical protein